MKKRVAEKIRLLRLQRGLSQQNIADELNLTVPAYSNIERGVTEVNLSRLSAIALILGTTPIELLTEDNFVKESDQFEEYNSSINFQISILSNQQKIFQKQLDDLQKDVDFLKTANS